MSVDKIAYWRKRIFSPVGFCTLVAIGYLYVLKEYVRLEYRIYKERKALEEHDADPTKLNMIIKERLLKKASDQSSQNGGTLVVKDG